FSSRRRHTRFSRDWSSDVCSSDLLAPGATCAYDRSPCAVRSATATVSSPPFVARTARYGVPPRQRGCAVTVTCGSVGGTSVRKRSEERRVGKEGRSRGGPG